MYSSLSSQNFSQIVVSYPIKKAEQDNKIQGLWNCFSTKFQSREGGATTELSLTGGRGRSHLSHVGVGIFRVNAPVPLHILEGIGHVAPSTAIILRHTIHQVLGAQV